MSWEQLLSIQQEAAIDRARELSEPPIACPNDGEPLVANPAGALHCPFDGYTYRG